MSLIPDTHDPSRLPPELRRADDAERDAGRACDFLREVGLAPRPGEMRRLPEAFLLDLGAAMRLFAWEEAGFTAHLEADLPTAREAILRAFSEAASETEGPIESPFRFCEAVFRLSVDRFSWTGRQHMNGEVLLDVPDEDAFVEAMARLLWEHKNTPKLEDDPGMQP